MNKIQVLVLGAISLAILGYFCIYNHSSIIQDDILTRVGRILDLEETQHIVINVQGRDITLSGEVATESIKQQAESLARKVDGVRIVVNKLKVANSQTSKEPISTSESEQILDPKPEKKEILSPEVAHLPEFSCQDDFDTLLGNNKINFSSNSQVIDESSYDLLNELVEVANQCADLSIEIAGHTDSQGSDEYNLELSQLRANSVMQYLINNGIDADRLSAIGYGENHPIADNDTPEGLVANRRIEFKVEGLKK